jgi:NarL family two-component system response regulator LiaR
MRMLMSNNSRPLWPPLTPREMEIAELLAQAKTNPEISKTLDIAPGTVKKHVTHILNKWNMKNRTEIALYVHQRLSEC